MSEPFPTKADIEFFTSEEAKRIQELWEPKCGDWYVSAVSGVWGIPFNELPKAFIKEERAEKYNYGEVIWLPRQGQLQAMLEERGYALAHLGDERVPPDFEGRIWNPKEPYIALAEREPGDYVKGIGPTPSIALGRALLEAIQRGKK